ncbi:hypothetical protein [Xanthocytophaga agilis]|uniref:Uncharacterized protein n=1 Tax=Xanthocytophaga agilis TaxID=3048010 RepID=A0AAE3RD61_9BACT|nr:hypothetical protein [Xanthocytophaga agilis]MDJ1506425.1 hypothetical protein [Xanthocytophaga agilis]
MEIQPSSSVRRFCIWSAASSFTFSLLYITGQVAKWLDLFGFEIATAQAPYTTGTGYMVNEYMVLLLSALLQAITFTILIIGIYHCTTKEKKIWSHVALVFALIYTVLISINYCLQFTFIVPYLATLYVEGDFSTALDSLLYSVNMLGYSFLSLSVFFVAFIFSGEKPARLAQGFLFANSLTLPFLILQNFYPISVWPSVWWAITFLGSTFSLLVFFIKIATKTSQAKVPKQIIMLDKRIIYHNN